MLQVKDDQTNATQLMEWFSRFRKRKHWTHSSCHCLRMGFVHPRQCFRSKMIRQMPRDGWSGFQNGSTGHSHPATVVRMDFVHPGWCL